MIREKISASESRAAPSIRPCLDRTGAHRLRVQAPAIVAYLDQHVGAGVAGREVDRTGGGFARRTADLRRLDTVIHAVADQMNQRIVQLIDDCLVQFRIGALDG